MQIVLKNSREELMRAFRKEYNAKRVAKTTQVSHTDNRPQQVDHVTQVEILPPVDNITLEYEIDERACKSARRPRRDAVPRTHTPPPRKSVNYHLLPWRVCLTNDEKSELAPSEMKERQEDLAMFQR